MSVGCPAYHDPVTEPAALIPAPRPASARVARVAVDVSLPHLDRPFDYAVTDEQDAAAVVGARVRVRFAGRLRDGFVLERTEQTDHEGRLAPLHAVTSPEPVLTPQVAALIRRVADHYAGTFADVSRLAVPPRHAATEKAERSAEADPAPADAPSVLDRYPTGRELAEALARGENPRAYWQVTPTAGPDGDWAGGLAEAAAATRRAGRGAIIVVPDHRDLDRLARACAARFGPDGFARLTAELGPSARYREFLRVSRGEVRVVIGTRAAAYAPVRDLGLVALWDDGDDLLAEPRAPYPHTREVLALRAAGERTAVVLAGYGRSAEIEQLVQTGWLTPLAQPRGTVRRVAPLVRIAADTDRALARDPAARAARLPHDTFEVVRRALPQGPVLVQVPRAGYRLGLVCAQCRSPLRCPHCAGPVRAEAGDRLDCGWCGRILPGWHCPQCGDTRWRAPVVGATRLAEELGRAFPNTRVIRSSGNKVVAAVGDEPALVVATPGAEPVAAGGYAAAVLVDATALLARPDLRAGEEALRRWLNAAALVRPAGDGGTVLAVGPPEARALQALVRLDPAGFARRELAERAEAHLPPGARVATLEGGGAAIGELLDPIRDELPAGAEVLGPVAVGELPDGGELQRLTLRVPRGAGEELARLLREAQGIRSARKAAGATRVRIDPLVME